MSSLTEFIGIVAACLTTISFLPQVILVLRTQNTQGISLGMYIAFVLGVVLWLVYGILRQDVAIMLANGLTVCLAGIVLYYKIIHILRQKN